MLETKLQGAFYAGSPGVSIAWGRGWKGVFRRIETPMNGAPKRLKGLEKHLPIVHIDP